MSEIFFKLWPTGSAISAPEIVRKSFNVKFPGAINIEWFQTEDSYEAVFYDADIEKISRFSQNGSWIETRTNLDITVLNTNVKISAERYGEIMNAILIELHDEKKYEVITRDKQLNRFLLILSHLGEIINNQPII
ncbi:MAG TPA: hypothetical protein VJ346_05120 [Bacteroidales bacterium]|nr:hypothetical protein [Bacteroidales bacterium]